jgi:pyruvate/2-oxoglutarate dehydrogenase complex dihydrolipoamide acyltransferase (E2) component
MAAIPLKGWRRVASAIWSAPRDPQIYGTLEVDARAVIAYIENARQRNVRLTPTHLVGRALTLALEEVPELNARIVGSHAYPRPRIEIFYITALGAGETDLSGVKVDMTRRSVFEVATELQRRVGALREGRDHDFVRSKRLMDALPRPLMRAALHATAFLAQTLQLDLPRLGVQKSPFGSAMISSVGSLGLSHGFAPLCWAYDVPLLLLVGQIAERPVVEDGKVLPRPLLPLAVTIDHRYVDGVHLSRAMRTFRAYLQSPASFEPELEPSSSKDALPSRS